MSRFNRFYKPKIDEAKKFVDKMFKEGSKLDDKELTAIFISPIKMEITPKEGVNIEELHRRFIHSLNKRHVLKYVACYIDNGKIYLEKMMI